MEWPGSDVLSLESVDSTETRESRVGHSVTERPCDLSPPSRLSVKYVAKERAGGVKEPKERERESGE